MKKNSVTSKRSSIRKSLVPLCMMFVHFNFYLAATQGEFTPVGFLSSNSFIHLSYIKYNLFSAIREWFLQQEKSLSNLNDISPVDASLASKILINEGLSNYSIQLIRSVTLPAYLMQFLRTSAEFKDLHVKLSNKSPFELSADFDCSTLVQTFEKEELKYIKDWKKFVDLSIDAKLQANLDSQEMKFESQINKRPVSPTNKSKFNKFFQVCLRSSL